MVVSIFFISFITIYILTVLAIYFTGANIEAKFIRLFYQNELKNIILYKYPGYFITSDDFSFYKSDEGVISITSKINNKIYFIHNDWFLNLFNPISFYWKCKYNKYINKYIKEIGLQELTYIDAAILIGKKLGYSESETAFIMQKHEDKKEA